MKDLTDTQTTDMHQPPPKRRGRPPTGRAMTPAERKRKQRLADENRILSSGPNDGKPVTDTGLISAIARAVTYGYPDLVMHHAQELANRVRERKAQAAAADKKP